MGDARRVIIAFLILLFVIVGIGVLLTRLARDKTDKPVLGGILENIFIDTTPSPTPESKLVINGETENETPFGMEEDVSDSNTMQADAHDAAAGYAGDSTNGSTKGASDQSGQSQGESKGGQPEDIPETGSPIAIVLLSLASLGGGIALNKRAKLS